LFIDEEFACVHVLDLGEPACLGAGQRADTIFDHLPGIHARREVADDAGAQSGRRDRVEIVGRGEKFPDIRGSPVMSCSPWRWQIMGGRGAGR
jgi:hypothetical protein